MIIGIYKIVSPSNKIYIGQSTNIERRIKYYKGLYCKNQTKLYNSLKKYGWKSHKFEIIEECKIEDLLDRENYWKDYYMVLDIPSLCCRKDGKGGYLSTETKEKIRDKALEINVGEWNKGRKQTTQEREFRSKIRKGYKPSKTHLKNMSKSMLGKNTKSIKCINLNKVFNSIREASKVLNLNERSISNNLLGYTQSLKNGYKFIYV